MKLRDHTATSISIAQRLLRGVEHIIASTGVGIVIVDSDLCIAFMNELASRFISVGKRDDDVIGLNLRAFVTRTDVHASIGEAMLNVVDRHRSGTDARTTIRVSVDIDDGTRLWFMLSAHGESQTYIEIANVTDVENERDLLAASKTKAQSANQQKTAFLAMLSHDLRNRLSAVLALADDAVEQNHATAVRIRSHADAALSLLDDVQQFVQLESGELEVTAEHFSFHALVEEIVADNFRRASSKGLVLSSDVERLVPPVVKGDVRHVRQLIENLVENGVKYTERGTITILVRAFDVTDESSSIQVSVVDTGPGISESDQKEIFKAYYRTRSVIDQGVSGTGLGLAICDRIAMHLGGALSVESRLGLGSAFHFRARFRTSPETMAADPIRNTHRPAERDASVFWPSILVVEDEPETRDLIARLAATVPAHVVTACDGAEGFARAKLQSFGLIVTDISMPELDGFGFITELREFERRNRRPRTPVVVLTAHSIGVYHQRAIEVGADAFLTKPIRRAAFIECVGQHLVRPIHTLVVDDDIDIAQHLARLIRSVFANARVDVEPPDFRFDETMTYTHCFVDRQLGPTDGTELVTTLRRTFPSATIIGMSANLDAETERAFCKAGTDLTIQKPVAETDVRRAMGKGRTADERRPLREINGRRAENGAHSTGSSSEAQLREEYVSRRQKEVNVLRAGTNVDRNTLRVFGHRLRGSGTSFGHPELSRLGGQIEMSALHDDEEKARRFVDDVHAYLAALSESQ